MWSLPRAGNVQVNRWDEREKKVSHWLRSKLFWLQQAKTPAEVTSLHMAGKAVQRPFLRTADKGRLLSAKYSRVQQYDYRSSFYVCPWASNSFDKHDGGAARITWAMLGSALRPLLARPIKIEYNYAYHSWRSNLLALEDIRGSSTLLAARQSACGYIQMAMWIACNTPNISYSTVPT